LIKVFGSFGKQSNFNYIAARWFLRIYPASLFPVVAAKIKRRHPE